MTTTSHASAPALAAQHTPGPWKIAGASAAPFINIESADGSDVCAVNDQWNEQTANARLIAAAPDLLAACLAIVAQAESARDQWESDGSERDTKEHGLAVCLNNRAGDLIRAAIAKATAAT